MPLRPIQKPKASFAQRYVNTVAEPRSLIDKCHSPKKRVFLKMFTEFEIQIAGKNLLIARDYHYF